MSYWALTVTFRLQFVNAATVRLPIYPVKTEQLPVIDDLYQSSFSWRFTVHIDGANDYSIDSANVLEFLHVKRK